MYRFATYQLFVRVIEFGCLILAAQELGLRQTAVSKQIAALETSVGTQLVERTSRSLRPTSAGLDLSWVTITDQLGLCRHAGC